MKIIKKLKVLVSLLTIFSLHSLINVSATEEKDKILDKNIYKTVEKKEEIEKKQSEKANEKQNKDIDINEEKYMSENIKEEKEQKNEKINLEEGANKKQYININEKEKELFDIKKKEKTNLEIFGYESNLRKQLSKIDNIFIEKKTTQPNIGTLEEEEQEKNEIKKQCTQKFIEQKIISEEELKNLSEKFSENFNNVFNNIMNRFGYYGGKHSLELGSPYILVQPFLYTHRVLKNGKKTFVPYSFLLKGRPSNNPYNYLLKERKSDHIYSNFFGKDFGEYKDLFSDFSNRCLYFNKYFGPIWLDIFGNYYQYCFKENLNSPVLIFNSDGEAHDVYNETLNEYFKLFYNNLKKDISENYKGNFQELIKTFLVQAYLKTFFVNTYGENYDFYSSDSEDRKDLLRFSRIFYDAFKCEFDEGGNLKAFNLDFNNAIRDEEDVKFLKRLNDAIDNKKESELLYDLYTATYAFLKNKEFWNKIIKIIVYVNGNIVKAHNFNYDALADKSISEYYFNLYGDVFKQNKFNYNNISNNNYKHVNYENIIDPDFNDLNTRFRNIFLMLNRGIKKGLFSKRGITTLTVNSQYAEELSAIDKKIKKNLEDYFDERFGHSFKILSDFKWLDKFFCSFSSAKTRFWFELFRNNDFRVSTSVMLEYLDRALQNERIRKECVALIRYLFNMYLIEGVITAYGNKTDVTNVSILRLVEYFDNILDLQIVKNEFGKHKLDLSFKKINMENYNAKNINRLIEKFNSEENLGELEEKEKMSYKLEKWNKATEEEKMIYRLYLSAVAFIKEKNFLNNLLAFLVCDNGIDVAKNFYSDSRELYDEYKDVNKAILNDKYFMNAENFDRELEWQRIAYDYIYNLPEEDILTLTDDFEGIFCFSTQKYRVFVDRIFIDYIVDKGYSEMKDKNFCENFFELLKKDKQSLVERFGENFSILNENDGFNKFISYAKNYGMLDRYRYFFYYELIYALQGLCSNWFKYIKGEDISINFETEKEFDKYYCNYILQNNKIVNECVSFIERFFCYYIKELIFDKNVKNIFNDIDCNIYNYKKLTNLKNLKVEALKNIVKPTLEWYSRMFGVKVEDGNIKFNFDLKYIDDEVNSNIKTFLNGFNKYNGKMEMLKNDNYNKAGENYMEKLERFLYNVHLDAIAFLNSEDFWNKYIKKVLFIRLLMFTINKNKINNSNLMLNPFRLDKEFLDVSEKIKKENFDKYKQMLNYIELLKRK